MEKEYTVRLQAIKKMLHTGLIVYDEAQQLAKPLLEELNIDMAAISKKHGRRHNKITFSYYMR